MLEHSLYPRDAAKKKPTPSSAAGGDALAWMRSGFATVLNRRGCRQTAPARAAYLSLGTL